MGDLLKGRSRLDRYIYTPCTYHSVRTRRVGPTGCFSCRCIPISCTPPRTFMLLSLSRISSSNYMQELSCPLRHVRFPGFGSRRKRKTQNTRHNRVLLCSLFHAFLCALSFAVSSLQVNTQQDGVFILRELVLHFCCELE